MYRPLHHLSGYRRPLHHVSGHCVFAEIPRQVVDMEVAGARERIYECSSELGRAESENGCAKCSSGHGGGGRG